MSKNDEIKTGLVSVQRQITSIMQDESEAKKFMASALIIANNRNLKDCTTESIIQATVGIAMSNLNIDPNIGHAYLVPYWTPSGTTAQLQISYKGFIQLLFRAGWLVKAFPVFTCDNFSMKFNGWDNDVEFIQNIDERDEGDSDWCFNSLRGIYAVARHADTHDELSLFVSRSVIEKLRLTSNNQKRSKDAGDQDRLKNSLPIGIWKDWYVEMAQAKAIKKLAKLLPLGDKRVQMAIATDDKNDIGQQVDYVKTNESGVLIDKLPTKKESILKELEVEPEVMKEVEVREDIWE